MALATIKEQILILFASEYSVKTYNAVKILASNFYNVLFKTKYIFELKN